jgi:dihydrodipicolinate synthase/N-acetylneuraminate lyase
MNTKIKKIVGPVIPIPTPFNQKFEVDYAALSNYVEFLMKSGVQNVMTTVGTSRFNLLTDDEVKKVNETVVKAAGGKIISIVANPTTGGMSQAIGFAKHAKEIGADFFLTYFPERFYGDDNTFIFFQTINDSVDIPILIHEMPLRNGYGPGTVQYSFNLLDRLLDLRNICGFKEEALDANYSNQIVSRYSDNAVIIGAGGGMSRYLFRDHDLGARAYLGGIGNFKPQIELDFYNAMINDNRTIAEKIVKEIELPYFNRVVPLGWHPTLKVALSLMNLMPGYERLPMKQLSSMEKEEVRNELLLNNWI